MLGYIQLSSFAHATVTAWFQWNRFWPFSTEIRSEFALKLTFREHKKLRKKENVFENIFNK